MEVKKERRNGKGATKRERGKFGWKRSMRKKRKIINGKGRGRGYCGEERATEERDAKAVKKEKDRNRTGRERNMTAKRTGGVA